MPLIPSNSLGNTVNTNAEVSSSDGILIGTASTGFPTSFTSSWLETSGMSKISIQCQSTDRALTPDSTVGSVVVTVEIANGVYPNFVSINTLGAYRIDQFLVPMTNTEATYPSSAIYREYNQVGSKYVRYTVTFTNLAGLVGNQYAKLFVTLMASS